MTDTDIILVGAGPIGVELAVGLKKAGAEYVHLEARQVGQTLLDWPPMTRFLSSPNQIAIAGVPCATLGEDRLLGEEYVAYLHGIVRQFGLGVRTFERVASIAAGGGGFVVRTERRTGTRALRCRRVVLATGDMACPARLGVPGEDLPHVFHLLPAPARLFGTRLLIVGGRNAAVEAAIRCCRAGASVTLCCRGPGIDENRVSHKLGPELRCLIDKGLVAFLPRRVPVAITPSDVALGPTDAAGRPADGPALRCEIDFVLVQIGFEADTSLFEQAGVAFDPAGKPAYDPETMETNIPGLYVAGTAAAGRQRGHEFFIETSHPHVRRILSSLFPAERQGVEGTPA